MVLRAGEFFVVPKGTEHRLRATGECQVMLFEPTGVINTGDAKATDGFNKTTDEWI